MRSELFFFFVRSFVLSSSPSSSPNLTVASFTPPLSAAAGIPAAPSRPRTPWSHPQPLATKDLTSTQHSAVTVLATSELPSCSQSASLSEEAVAFSLAATAWQAPVLRLLAAARQAGLPVGGGGGRKEGSWARTKEQGKEEEKSARRERAAAILEVFIMVVITSVVVCWREVLLRRGGGGWREGEKRGRRR